MNRNSRKRQRKAFQERRYTNEQIGEHWVAEWGKKGQGLDHKGALYLA